MSVRIPKIITASAPFNVTVVSRKDGEAGVTLSVNDKPRECKPTTVNVMSGMPVGFEISEWGDSVSGDRVVVSVDGETSRVGTVG